MRLIPVAIGSLVLIAACRRPAPTARERLLAQIRGDLVMVAIADGAAIGHPRIRAVLDAVAAHAPPGLACVLEAAATSDQTALSVDRGRNITVLVATAVPPACGALSQREPGLWIATVGAGPSAGPASVLGDDRLARARPYLRTAPIAAAVLGEAHVLATAQPEPFEAWLAIDTPAAHGDPGAVDAAAQAIAAQIARLRADPSTALLASKLRLSRAGDTQVVVHLDDASGVDLAAAARTVVGWAEQPARPAAESFACPPAVAAPGPQGALGAPGAPADIACTDGTHFRARSLRVAVSLIATAGQPSAVVANGAVTGLRLAHPVGPLGLLAGDVVVAIDGRLVVSRAMFLHLLAGARTETRVTVRRRGTEKVLHFVER